MDFPTPGSPPTRTNDPRLTPPPRTRAISAPVGPNLRTRENNLIRSFEGNQASACNHGVACHLDRRKILPTKSDGPPCEPTPGGPRAIEYQQQTSAEVAQWWRQKCSSMLTRKPDQNLNLEKSISWRISTQKHKIIPYDAADKQRTSDHWFPLHSYQKVYRSHMRFSNCRFSN